MSVRENLCHSIREYVAAAEKSPDSRGLIERLNELENEVSKAIDPQPQGAGVISSPNAHSATPELTPNAGGADGIVVNINVSREQLRRSHAKNALKRAHKKK